MSLMDESSIPKVRWSMDLQEMDAGQSSKSGCLKTVSGRYVDLLEPQPDAFVALFFELGGHA